MTAVKMNKVMETPSAGNAQSQTGSSDECRVRMPTGALLSGVIGATLLVAAVCWIVDAILSLNGEVSSSGVAGAVAVGIVAVYGVLIMTPWKARPIADWMTMWLAATVFRLLLTPAVVYVLYSAFLPDWGGTNRGVTAVKPLVLSVASTYFVALLTEAAILASHVRRCSPSA